MPLKPLVMIGPKTGEAYRETSKNVYPEKVSDLVAWKLMLRLLRT
jgi:hypothetical protein